MTQLPNNEQPLNILVGCELSSIEFVQDYVQFRFGGPSLTAYIHPVLEIGATRYYWDTPIYYFMLHKQIGKMVLEATIIIDEALYLKFNASTYLSISLRPEDYVTPEAVMFIDGDGHWWLW